MYRKVAPIVGVYRPIGDHRFQRSRMRGWGVEFAPQARIPLLRRNRAEHLGLNARNELHFIRTHFAAQETVNVQRALRVEAVDDR